MLNMSQINRIKDAYASGYSYAKIAQLTGHDVKTVKKYLWQEDFSPKKPIHSQSSSILDVFKQDIDHWLLDDQNRHPKQRHTAKRIYDRLRLEKAYRGSYPTVQRYVRDWRKNNQKFKSYQDLLWYPGQCQVDLGEAYFIVRGLRKKKFYLTMTFPYSNYALVQLVEDETAISICTALQNMFSHLNRVPNLLVFDNASGIGKKLDHGQIESKLFAQFRAHYKFQLRFCNRYAGYEKGNVENKVGYVRRNYFVPERSYENIADFNAELFKDCQAYGEVEHYEKGELVKTLFNEELEHMRLYPREPFDVCEYHYYLADNYGRLCIDSKHCYGSLPEHRGQRLLARIRAYEITLFNPDGSVLVSYPRIYGKRKTVNTLPETSLKHLSRHPGAWFNSRVRESLIPELRQQLDALDSRTRRDLLATFSVLSERYSYSLALEAISMALARKRFDFDAIDLFASRLGTERGEHGYHVSSFSAAVDIPPKEVGQ